MGGSPSISVPKAEDAPPQAAPLDYAALMASANDSAAAAAQAQIDAQIAAYPQMEALQLGTVQQIANNLSNQYTVDALNSVNRSATDANNIRNIGSLMLNQAQSISGTGNKVEGIGSLLSTQAGPTSIEQELYRQAAADLALGRSLNPEEVRNAQQSARSAFAARGLGTSSGSAAAEILNRDAYASQREADRRNFAANTNNMVSTNVFNRYGQVANLYGAAGGLYGNAANVQSGASNTFAQGANIDQGAASLYANLDPYSRALGYSQIGSNIGTALTNSLGNTWTGAQDLAGSVASYNASMLDSRYNSYMNNQSALQAAQLSAGASQNAGMMGMVGGIGGGVLTGVGLAL